MTTFVLKRYEQPVQETPPNKEAQQDSGITKTEAMPQATVSINAHDSISKIVAAALYSSMPNTVEVREVSEADEKITQDAIKVISTESVNTDPVMSIRFVSGESDVAVIGNGFHTEKDEWFLSTLNTRGNNVIYSMESVIAKVKSALGVQ